MSLRMPRTIRLLSCEIWWIFTAHVYLPLRTRALRWWSADVGLQRSPASLRAKEISALRNGIRAHLRRTPQWAMGHVRFALLELESLEQQSESPAPRSRAAIRLSAEAALTLEHGYAEPLTPLRLREISERGRVSVEAEYIQGRERFLDRDFTAAWSHFEEILKPNRAVQLSKQVHDAALEFGSNCLMAMGEATRARELLLEIAPAARSVHVKRSLLMLHDSSVERVSQ